MMTETSLIDTKAWVGCMVTLLLLGLLGNALTLWAIGYATVRKKYGFAGVQWLTTTIFILNLAFVDTVYCVFMLGYMFYVPEEWTGTGICQFLVLGSQQLAAIDGSSIALIAFTRGVPYIK